MAKRKNFSIVKSLYVDACKNKADVYLELIDAKQVPPSNTNIFFPINPTCCRNFDFAPYYNQGIDTVTWTCQCVIQTLLEESIQSQGNTLSVSTIVGYCKDGLKHFLPFCHLMRVALDRELSLADIDRGLIDQYIVHLASGELKNVSQCTYYTNSKSVLTAIATRGMIEPTIFPKNPYPNINRQKKGHRSLSNPERKKVLRALKVELLRIADETGPLTAYDLSVCVLGIAARTGLNTTPILELPLNCLQSHPLKLDRRLLVSYKSRGNSTRIQSLRKSDDLEIFRTVMMDVTQIIDVITVRNAEVRAKCFTPELLFVFERTDNSDKSQRSTSKISSSNLMTAIKIFVERFHLVNDDGVPLVLNVMRLRKTFENRIWELSGQDPFITAALGGHSMKVSNDHYLDAPEESEENWRMMGEIRVAELLEKGRVAAHSVENTPIAGCKDSRHGHRAPKNGEHCSDFLNCFRCRSFVVTGDDLYRLFSFYWLLVSERELIGAQQWSRYYAHIVRIIDRQIAPQFDAVKVQAAREKSRNVPHPFWRNREQLGLEI